MENFEGYNIQFLDTIDSTNNEAKNMVSNGHEGNKFVLWADFQEAGKGQKGNHWESERGKNLLFTVCMQPEGLHASKQFYISMATALAVCKTLNSKHQGFQIKWPNDIYYQGKKVCGMLTENILKGSCIAQSFIGIGININQTKFVSDAPNPASLQSITQKEYDRKEILETFIQYFQQYFQMMEKGETEQLEQQYKEQLFLLGQLHTYKDKDGIFQAKIADVTFDGRLHLIDTEGTEKSYYFKEIKYILNKREYE